MAAITLNVNGTSHDLDLPPEMPLLWALRDVIGLTGTKYSCGMGLCGSCTVHVDGGPTRSCVTPIGAVATSQIVTIEGLSPDGSHPIQQAWLEANVSQCGYCQAGQIMQTVALLNDHANPTDEDIDNGMFGNLCRCGTYQRIRQAIHAAAENGG